MVIFKVIIIDPIRKLGQYIKADKGLFISAETLQMCAVHHDGSELIDMIGITLFQRDECIVVERAHGI